MKPLFSILAVAALALVACNKDKKSGVEDGAVFPGDPDNILIEVTVPQNTASTDEVFLAGPVTGGQEDSPAFKLKRSSKSGNVLAAYLDPNDFIGGKTLADPFWFVSKALGVEVDANGNKVTHTLADAAVGKCYNITLKAWKGKGSGEQGGDQPGGDQPGGDEPGGDEPGGDEPGGDTPPQPEDGSALVYVYDISGFGDMWLYAWQGAQGSDSAGTVPDTPAFPGVKNEGTETINGHSFYKFTLGAAYLGKEINVIFDDGSPADGKQTDNTALTFAAKTVRYFTAPWGLPAEEIADPASFNPGGGDTPPEPPQPGTGSAKIYVYDGKGWGMDMHLWAWNSDSNLCGSDWPGTKTPSATETVSGNVFYVFDLDSSFMGEISFLICNSNGTSQTADYGPVTIADGGKYYYDISGISIAVINPENFNPGGQSSSDVWSICGNFGGGADWSDLDMDKVNSPGEDTWHAVFTYTTGLVFKFRKNHDWAQGDYGYSGGSAISLPLSADIPLTQAGGDISLTGVNDGATLELWIHFHKDPVDFWVQARQ